TFAIIERTVTYVEDSRVFRDETDVKGKISINCYIEITGTGNLSVLGHYNHGIISDDSMVITNGNIKIQAASNALHANDVIRIKSGDIYIIAQSNGIESEKDIIIDGGTLQIQAQEDGIHAENNYTINDGIIDILDSYKAIEAKATITINGGDLTLISSDDAINSGENMDINGGAIYVDCEGDGFNSNSDMNIAGGDIEVYAGSNSNGPINIGDNDNALTITGGNIFMSGGPMMVTVSSNSTQPTIWIGGNLSSQSELSISEDTNQIYNQTLVKSGSLIFYSSDTLKKDINYTIKTNGNTLGTATLSSYNVTIGNIQNGLGGTSSQPR
ncbi:MAG: carbohydrate-binding domain-containing protein, partial [Coprobacillaceae bacterium]